jgi:hypothetical protein
MYIRDSLGKLVFIDVSKFHDETEMYNNIWSIKFNKQIISPSIESISINKMKNYLGNKCFSI